jgi:DNA-binding response OmpR family regulator
VSKGEVRVRRFMEFGGYAATPSAAGEGMPEDLQSGRSQPWRQLRERSLSHQRLIYDKGRLRIDFDAYEVFLDGRRVQLFLREFEILCLLVQWPNRVFDRRQILDLVWGHETDVDPRTIDVHVRRLRAAIERDPARPELIVTIRRVGYKFDERALDAPPPAASPREDV